MTEIKQFNNKIKGEFLAFVNEKKAGLLTYTWAGNNKILIDNIEVEKKFEANSIGTKMIIRSVIFARLNNLKIIPICSFAKEFFRNTKEIQDVLS